MGVRKEERAREREGKRGGNCGVGEAEIEGSICKKKKKNKYC